MRESPLILLAKEDMKRLSAGQALELPNGGWIIAEEDALSLEAANELRPTGKERKVHWTQTPAGREKVAAMMKRRWEKRRGHKRRVKG